jgi:hypothetical protein
MKAAALVEVMKPEKSGERPTEKNKGERRGLKKKKEKKKKKKTKEKTEPNRIPPFFRPFSLRYSFVVRKRNGELQAVSFDKISQRIQILADGLKHIEPLL